jgi:hypothetical protein
VLPAQYPAVPTGAHPLAYDAARREVVMFGVRDDDTWVWNGAVWTHRLPAHRPPARREEALAYDAARQRVVLFGGRGGSPLDDTWEWDGTDWAQRITMRSPPGGRAFLAFDAVRGVSVLWSAGSNDTWEYDGADWTLRLPGTGPPETGQPSLVFDPGRGAVLRFRYRGDGVRVVDAWDGSGWRGLYAERRFAEAHYAVHDARRMLLYDYVASLNDPPQARVELFEDDARFSDLGEAAVVRRFGAGVAWDAARERLCLFGGTNFGPLPLPPDTWLFDPGEVGLAVPFGLGCHGTVAQAPELFAQDPPVLGTTVELGVRSLPLARTSVPWGLLGFSRSEFSGMPLPIPLDAIGMTGCELLVAPTSDVQLVNEAGHTTWLLPLPGDPALAGVDVYTQCFVLDPFGNPLGAILSNGLRLRLALP